MANAREFEKKLETFKVNMQHDHIDFSAIESLLLNADYRTLLSKDKALFDKFTTLYKQAIAILSDEIYQISLYRFIAITPDELTRIGEPAADPIKSPRYSLYVKNCQGLLSYVFYDIIQYEDPTLTIMAYKRWALIMSRLVSLNDYASAVQINSVLEYTLGNFKAFVDKPTLQLIEYMNKIFDSGLRKFESMRDQYFGPAIPLVANYSSYITAVQIESLVEKKEKEPEEIDKAPAKAAGESVKPSKELTPRQKIVINKTVSTITHLQANCALLMGIKYDEAIFTNGFKDERVFAREDEYNNKTANLVKRFEKDINGLSIDDLRDKLTQKRKASLRDAAKSKLTLDFNDALMERCSFSVPEEHVGYYEHVHALRQYSRSKTAKVEGSKRRTDLEALLGDLSFESRILEKIDLIKSQLAVNEQYYLSTQVKLYRPEVVKILKEMINHLNARADRERKVLAKISASKMLKDSKGVILSFAQTEDGAVTFNLNRLNLSNTKAVHTEPVKQRVNFEDSKEQNQMTWAKVLEMTKATPARNLSDSDSKNSEDDKVSQEESLGLQIIPSNFSSASNSPPPQRTPTGSPKLSPVASSRRLDLERIAHSNQRRNSQSGGDETKTSPLESPNSETSPPISAHGKGGLGGPKISNTTMPEVRQRLSRGGNSDKVPVGGVLRKTRSSELGSESNAINVSGSQVNASNRDSSCSPPPPLTIPIPVDTSSSEITDGSTSPQTPPPVIDTPNANLIREELRKAEVVLAAKEKERVGGAERKIVDSSGLIDPNLPAPLTNEGLTGSKKNKNGDDKSKKRRSVEIILDKLRDAIVGSDAKSESDSETTKSKIKLKARVDSDAEVKLRDAGDKSLVEDTQVKVKTAKPLDSEGRRRRQEELWCNQDRFWKTVAGDVEKTTRRERALYTSNATISAIVPDSAQHSESSEGEGVVVKQRTPSDSSGSSTNKSSVRRLGGN